jgi:hypothetical protein
MARYRNGLYEITSWILGNAMTNVSLQENAEKNIAFVLPVRRMQMNLNRKARFVVPGQILPSRIRCFYVCQQQ